MAGTFVVHMAISQLPQLAVDQGQQAIERGPIAPAPGLEQGGCIADAAHRAPILSSVDPFGPCSRLHEWWLVPASTVQARFDRQVIPRKKRWNRSGTMDTSAGRVPSSVLTPDGPAGR